MRPIDFFASQRHYGDHLAPIVDVARERGWLGNVWTSKASTGFGAKLTRAAQVGSRNAVVVAGAADAKKFADRAVVYVEHGAGQTYGPAPEWGWPGARGLPQVVLYVTPGAQAGALWRAAYPTTPVAEVGCPKLDEWAGLPARRGPLGDLPRVALTFRWNCELVPEARTAAPHYLGALPSLLEQLAGRAVLLGHGHPRAYGHLAKTWRLFHVKRLAHLRDVFDQATVLVGDNTSALYEFAALGRPVIALNAPWYRRDVDHGLRFWSHVPGDQVDDPRWLPHAIDRALTDPGATAEARAHATAHVYAAVDGHAAERAADAIEEVCGG